MPALDIYSPPKPKQPTGIPGLDDEPIGDSPLLADMATKKQALAIQRQTAQQSAAQAQQSAAQEKRQQAEYEREERSRMNQPPIPAGLAPSAASKGPDGKVTLQYSAPTPVTTGIISEKDVADAGIDPNSIPRNEWPAAVAKAKSGREGKMTEMQSNALQYSARMAYNRDILDKLESKGFDAASVGTGVQHFTPNIMRSPEVQTYRAARDNWVSAVLRKESGAAISKSEYENAYRQYFPQMGDAPEIIKQKRDLRKIAEDNMKLVAGGRASEAETSVPATGTPPAQPNAAPAPAATPQQPSVRMRTPGGQIILVPAPNVPAAQARGATPL
jgi:hypothetical protein